MLCITNNSVKYQLFVYTQLNGQTVLFLRIQSNAIYLFTHSLNVKPFYLIHRYDPIRCYHSGTELTWVQWQWKGTQHSPNLQGWRLAIRWFNTIYRTLLGGLLPRWRDAVGVFYIPSQLGFNVWRTKDYFSVMKRTGFV